MIKATTKTTDLSGDNKTGNDHFVRIESKFLASNHYLKGIEHLLQIHLKPVDGTKEFGITKVETLYFDTPDLRFFTSSLKKLPHRIKLRIRKYLSKDANSFVGFLELKGKENGISKKSRFRIGQEEELLLLSGKTMPLSDSLTQQNRHLNLAELESRLQTVNDIIISSKPELFVKINYDRKAYEGQGIRVTIDNNVSYRFYDEHSEEFEQQAGLVIAQDCWRLGTMMCASFSRRDDIIVEVKHTDAIPEWLQNHLTAVAKISDATFSKYVWGMAHTILKGRV
ncbi:MAG: polyphosphate polymerase domain-containing protein [Pseudomonadota bacterium]|nr:polyphosphate polymerase domain-containing protein [Pseudomonadota bacterium]